MITHRGLSPAQVSRLVSERAAKRIFAVPLHYRFAKPCSNGRFVLFMSDFKET